MKKVPISIALLLIACCSIILVCYTSAQKTNSSSVEYTALQSVHSTTNIISSEKKSEIDFQSPMALSNTELNFNGQTVYLCLKMVKGRYYEDWNPGAYMGPNWEGQFVIDLVDEFGKTFAETDISKMFTEPLTFNSSFKIDLDDYNNDSDLDFTVGQYCSNNGYLYKIFTIRKDGKVEELPVKDHSNLFISDRTANYSTKLNKINGTTFEIEYYDNSVPATFQDFYQWDGKEFVLSKSQKMTQEDASERSFQDENTESTKVILSVKTTGTNDTNKFEYDNLIDTDYIRALRTLDEFLYLWTYRNWPEGIKYISESLKKVKSEEELKSAICGTSNPHHMSFEVLGAKKTDKDTFRFNVWLYEDITGENNNASCERSSPEYIVVKRYKSSSGEEHWMIDKF